MNYKLWLSLLCMLLIPSVYTTLRVFFLNSAPDTSHVSIAAQSVWLGLIYEVLSEALVLPLYFIFGQVVRQTALLRQRVSFALGCSALVYAIATLAVWCLTDFLLQTMQQHPAEREVAGQFIRLEALGFMAGVLNDVCLVVLTSLALHRWILALVLLRALLMVVFDTLLVSQWTWSLELGVIGVALTNLTVGLLLCSVSFAVLRHLGLLAWGRVPLDSSWIKAWLRVASFSGMEAALRNLVYAWVILRLINQTGAAPLYWNANQIIWAWLLVPILALGQVVRQDAATSQGALAKRWRSYALALVICTLAWWALQPLWGRFTGPILGIENILPVHDLMQQLLPFYAVFSVTFLLQNYLYGLGRTDLILQQSIVVNVLYYGAASMYLVTHSIEPSLSHIVWIFGGGLGVSLAFTLWQLQRHGYWLLARKTQAA